MGAAPFLLSAAIRGAAMVRTCLQNGRQVHDQAGQLPTRAGARPRESADLNGPATDWVADRRGPSGDHARGLQLLDAIPLDAEFHQERLGVLGRLWCTLRLDRCVIE